MARVLSILLIFLSLSAAAADKQSISWTFKNGAQLFMWYEPDPDSKASNPDNIHYLPAGKPASVKEDWKQVHVGRIGIVPIYNNQVNPLSNVKTVKEASTVGTHIVLGNKHDTGGVIINQDGVVTKFESARYEFGSGNWVEIQQLPGLDDRILFRPETGDFRVVYTGKVTSVTTPDDKVRLPSGIERVIDPRNTHIAFGSSARGELGVLQNDGVTATFPVEFSVTQQIVASKEILRNGSTYRIFHFSSQQAGDVGDTYIVRFKDNRSVRIGVGRAVGSLSPDKVQDVDGVLKIEGIPRRIDLDAFDKEAERQSRRGPVVNNSDGKPIDVVADVRERFADLMEEARARKAEGLPLPPTPDEDILMDVNRVLMDREQGGAALLGESGSGKTTFMEGFAQLAIEGKVPEHPRSWPILALDTGGLTGGTGIVGLQQNRTSAVLNASLEMPILWFADEFHTLRGGGTSSKNDNDALESLKPGLARGTLRMIAGDTRKEFSDAFSSDPALRRRFIEIHFPDPPKDRMLGRARTYIQERKWRVPGDEVMEELFHLADNYSAVGSTMSRLTTLIRRTFNDLKIKRRADETPTISDVRDSASSLYRIKRTMFDPAARRQMLNNLSSEIAKYVIGHPHVIKKLNQLTRQAAAGVHDAQKPAVRVFLAGPSGVGKTELAKAYAKARGVHYEPIEMNQFSTAGDTQKVLYQVRQALEKDPFAVLLFDEFEKAHINVQNELLSMLNDGRFMSADMVSGGKGHNSLTPVIARNASVILTSNAGAKFIMENPNATEAQIKEAVIQGGVSTAVFDRMQSVLAVRSAPPNEFREIMALHLHKAMKEQVERHGFKYEFTNEADFLAYVEASHYHANISNREALKIIQDDLRSSLAEAVLDDTIHRDADLRVTFHPPTDTEPARFAFADRNQPAASVASVECVAESMQRELSSEAPGAATPVVD